jgi:hypothetical protein
MFEGSSLARSKCVIEFFFFFFFLRGDFEDFLDRVEVEKLF